MLGTYVTVTIVYVCSWINFFEGRNHQVDVLWIVEIRISAKPLKGVHFGVKRRVLGPDLYELVIHVFVDELLDDRRQQLDLGLDAQIHATCRLWLLRLLKWIQFGVHLLLELVKEFIGARLVLLDRIDISDHLLPHARPMLLESLLYVLP